MAKQSGLGDNFYIGGRNIGGDVSSLSNIHGGPALLDVTDITQSAIERRGGYRDGGMSFVTWFDDVAGAEHLALRPLPLTDTIATYFRGTAIGNAAASVNCKQINYDGTRSDDGQYSLAVDCQANGFGLEWGYQLTPGVRTDTAATNGVGLDTVASASFGGQAYLQVFSLTGTSVTVKIQDSADNATFADVAGFAFVAATTNSVQRIALANTTTLRRYLRVATTGTFTNAQFAVQVVKNDTAGIVF